MAPRDASETSTAESAAADETDLLAALRAVAEQTRLRIVLLLDEAELTVRELCTILDQSQPRVSRHLAVLCDAGVLERHAQGTSAFYRPAPAGLGRRLLDSIVDLEPSLGPEDAHRLASVRGERARRAAEYFERVAASWDDMRPLHVGDDEVEAAMLDAISDRDVSTVLDVGTGTGRILELLAPQVDQAVGIDLSPQMLDLARSRLDDGGHTNCSVRQADVYRLDADQEFDLITVHHVLHFLDDPGTAIARFAGALRPGGRMLIVDFAAHDHDRMRSDFAHHWLGFDAATVSRWCTDAGLDMERVTDLTKTDASDEDHLTVRLWLATTR